MSIEKMEFVNIVGMMKSLDATLIRCIESGCFHVETSSKTISKSQQEGFCKLTEQNPYKDMLKKLATVNFGKSFQFHQVDWSEINDMSMEQKTQYISGIDKKLISLNQNISIHNEALSRAKQSIIQIERLRDMNINMRELFTCTHIKMRFGRLPMDSYLKLEYYSNKTFIFYPYNHDKNYYWGVYFAPKNNIAEIDEIFNSLYYERIRVPDFIENTPNQEIEFLKADIEKHQNELDILLKQREVFLSSETAKINMIYCKLKFQHDNFELRRYVSAYKGKFYIIGFIPQKDAKTFMNIFDDLPDVSVVLKPPDADERVEIPVKLKNSKFAQPFSMFVEMYGLPEYNGFNPTSLVAVTYTLLFGLMFGDLGQGLVISLLGFIMNKRKRSPFAQILTTIGLSSACFGLIFGSVFGFENALDPLYHAIGLEHKPFEVMENTMVVLLGAICIGVVLILISIILNIFISFRKKDFERSIFGNNGIMGLIFYGSLLAGVANLAITGRNIFTPIYIILLLILPLIVMFFREPLGCLISNRKFHFEGIGDFIASNFFELFEFLLSYATNTLSFVRIGGFIFSHAGMMSVVMLLSESVAQGASPIVVIIGNIFVMAMEGMIVGIQVLRLEFYEIFSRFYDGDGKAFEPVEVKYNSEIE